MSNITSKLSSLPFNAVARYAALFQMRKAPSMEMVLPRSEVANRYFSPLFFHPFPLPATYYTGNYNQTHSLFPYDQQRVATKSPIATTRDAEMNNYIHPSSNDPLKEETFSRREDENISVHFSTRMNTSKHLILLSLEGDKNKISELQCYLREQIEVFTATEEDVKTHSRGRNKPIEVLQVGLRCKHCCVIPLKERTKGSCYFSTTLDGIYQAAQNMYHHHFQPGCPYFKANENESKFKGLMSSRSSSKCGKDYWRSTAAVELGLVETSNGLRFKAQIKKSTMNQETNEIDPSTSEIVELANRDANNIVNHEHRNLVTDYIFILISQMRPCVKFDCTNDIKIPGLMCKYCKGAYGYGLFFRSEVSSLSKNQNLTQIEKHLHGCRHCPIQVKNALVHSKSLHQSQLKKVKRGDKKLFFSYLMSNISKNLKMIKTK